jgi:amidohydrolase
MMASLNDKLKELYKTTPVVAGDIYRYIHQNPELSFRESGTSSYVASYLESLGIGTIKLDKSYSLLATIDGTGEGKTIGLRAELDALPIDEKTGESFASRTAGVMHACGHDFHLASIISTALILNNLREFWSGRVVLVLESGEEELPGGARAILESNDFQKFRPDYMIGMHVLPELEVGKVGFCPGRYMASGDEVYLTVRGRGGHAALPHTLTDPVIIASTIILSLQTLVSRKASVNIPSVLSFGRVTANGSTNVIPDEVSISGTFRTMDEEWRAKTHNLITQMASGIAKSMGAECAVEIRKGYPSVYNDPTLTQTAIEVASSTFGTENVVHLEPRMTTDDFSYFSQAIPSVFFRIGVGGPGAPALLLHRSDFRIDEQAFQTSLPMLTGLCLKLLTSS